MDGDGDTRCRTNAFVNIYWIAAANGLFRARAAAHSRLRWHFSLMYTGGGGALFGEACSSSRLHTFFRPLSLPGFFTPNEKNERHGEAPYRAR